MKQCFICLQNLSDDRFNRRGLRNGRIRRSSSCKECEAKRRNPVKRNDHIRRAETQRARYALNRSPFYKANLKWRYKLTDDEVDFIVNQARCEICGTDGEGRKLVVDHCHREGFTRGILCQRCNVAVGMFLDDVMLLQNAIDYIIRTT